MEVTLALGVEPAPIDGQQRPARAGGDLAHVDAYVVRGEARARLLGHAAELAERPLAIAERRMNHRTIEPSLEQIVRGHQPLVVEPHEARRARRCALDPRRDRRILGRGPLAAQGQPGHAGEQPRARCISAERDRSVEVAREPERRNEIAAQIGVLLRDARRKGRQLPDSASAVSTTRSRKVRHAPKPGPASAARTISLAALAPAARSTAPRASST
jgi:hypothetical protein